MNPGACKSLACPLCRPVHIFVRHGRVLDGYLLAQVLQLPAAESPKPKPIPEDLLFNPEVCSIAAGPRRVPDGNLLAQVLQLPAAQSARSNPTPVAVAL